MSNIAGVPLGEFGSIRDLDPFEEVVLLKVMRLLPLSLQEPNWLTYIISDIDAFLESVLVPHLSGALQALDPVPLLPHFLGWVGPVYLHGIHSCHGGLVHILFLRHTLPGRANRLQLGVMPPPYDKLPSHVCHAVGDGYCIGRGRLVPSFAVHQKAADGLWTEDWVDWYLWALGLIGIFGLGAL